MVQLCGKVDKADLPEFLSVVNGSDWIAETKEDGDRMRLDYRNRAVTLSNRRGAIVTHLYPELHSLHLSEEVLLDGEICVMNANGVSAFNEGIAFRSHCKHESTIKEAMGKYPVIYVVFDLLELNGEDLRLKPLSERRKLLEGLNLKHPHIKLIEQFTDIKDAWDKVGQFGWEGLILKNVNSTYRDNYRSSNWRKVKNIKEVDLKFTKFEQNPQGITVENTAGIRCLVGGRHQYRVKELLDTNGEVTLTINHLGKTKAGKYRQPTYNKVVEV